MTKISIISDLHFGFGDGVREGDVFRAAREAFTKSKKMGSDIVILAGDIFNSRFPKPEHWSRAMELLSIFQEGGGAEIVSRKSEKKINGSAANGIPVVALHGTHERRSEEMTNPIEGLEKAGFLTHLHRDHLVLKKNGEKIAIHGMSGVPEKYSKKVLEEWNPCPQEGSYNIFMMHQNLEPYIYNPVNPPKLSLKDLPNGFDCYISGHIHWKEKTEIEGKPFLIPGSLIPTQLKKKEAEREKGFYFLDTEKESIEFIPLDQGRNFFYKKIQVEEENPEKIRERVEKTLKKIVEGMESKKPLIRIKIEGKLAKGVDSNELGLSNIVEPYRKEAIVTIRKDLKEKEVEGKIQLLRDLRREKVSIDEIGMDILRQEVKATGSNLDPDLIFSDLTKGKVDRALEKLLKESEDEAGSSTEGKWWEK